MKIRSIFFVATLLAMGLVNRAEADWHGGFHGGGGWHGGWHGGGGWYGPGIVIGGYPGYYPYYGYYDTTYYGSAYPVAPGYPPPAYQGRAVATQGGLTVQVQTALSQLGYYHGDIDGIIGPESRAAIAAYKRDRGMDPTGIIDGPLLNSLRL